jgi:hypothetical protein
MDEGPAVLLQEIIDGAVAGSTPVSTLLRAVQVLAVRTGALDLETWARAERDGYGEGDQLPPYRGPLEARVVGHFSGFGGSEITDLPIPRGPFPEQFAPMFIVELRQSAAALEDLVSSAAKDNLVIPWSADAVAVTNGLIDAGQLTLVPMHHLLTARRLVPRSTVVELVDGIRNRVLDLALQLEKTAPELSAGAAPTVAQREKASAATQTVIYAHTAHVGDSYVRQNTIQITPGDSASLDRYLAGLPSLPEEARAEIVAAAISAADLEPASKLKTIWAGSRLR